MHGMHWLLKHFETGQLQALPVERFPLAQAAEAMVGKAVGQKNKASLEHTVKLTLRWSLIFSAGFTLVYLLAGPLIVLILGGMLFNAVKPKIPDYI